MVHIPLLENHCFRTVVEYWELKKPLFFLMNVWSKSWKKTDENTLSPLFTDSASCSSKGHHTVNKRDVEQLLSSKTFLNFKFDRDAIMKCFDCWHSHDEFWFPFTSYPGSAWARIWWGREEKDPQRDRSPVQFKCKQKTCSLKMEKHRSCFCFYWHFVNLLRFQLLVIGFETPVLKMFRYWTVQTSF